MDANQAARAIPLLPGETLPPGWILTDRPDPARNLKYYIAARVSVHESGRTWLNAVLYHQHFSTLQRRIKYYDLQKRYKQGQQKQADRQLPTETAIPKSMRQILQGDKAHRRQEQKANKATWFEQYEAWKASRKAEREAKKAQKELHEPAAA